jgi:hypothetical protein
MKMRLPSYPAIIKLLAIVVLVIIATSASATSFANANINTDGTMDLLHKDFPEHWGSPPLRQTRDYVPLPEPYGGRGSSTLKKWIEQKMEEDAAAAEAVAAAEAGEKSNARRFADPSTASAWPEKSLVGMTGEAAKNEIKDVDPSLEVHVLPEDSMVTMDYREDRVRIFVDADGKVVRQPNAG